jgi:hypothetical protein
MTGGAEVSEGLPRHAGARVEDEKDRDGRVLEAHEADLLSHPVVAEFEVLGGEVGDRLPGVGHEDVHMHGLDEAREVGRLLQPQSRQAERDPHRRCDHRQASSWSCFSSCET